MVDTSVVEASRMAARADYTVVDEPIMVEVVVVAIVIEQMAAVKVETEVDGRAEVAAVVVDKAIAQMVELTHQRSYS
jgi:acetylornithine deacetylase/succinyl-diaminopimelate desuccinylase-like protein